MSRLTIEWRRTAARLLFVFGATGIAFWQTWAVLVHDMSTGSTGGSVLVIAALALFAAMAIAVRPQTGLPIHDRQTDTIVAIMGMGFAIGTDRLWLPRFSMLYYLLHLDVLAAWVFLVSACALVFGLRPLFRFWPAWLLAAAAFPLPYQCLLIVLDGSAVAAGVAIFPFIVVSAAITLGTIGLRFRIGGLTALTVAVVALGVLAVSHPYAPMWWYQAIPAAAALVALTLMADVAFRRGSFEPTPISPLTARNVVSGLIVVTIATGVIATSPG